MPSKPLKLKFGCIHGSRENVCVECNPNLQCTHGKKRKCEKCGIKTKKPKRRLRYRRWAGGAKRVKSTRHLLPTPGVEPFL